jgi:hypothetical protein
MKVCQGAGSCSELLRGDGARLKGIEVRFVYFSHFFIFFKKKGILCALDGYMNLALEQTEEFVGGQLKNRYADTFIRGNNVLYIAEQE